jgi:hypothetical protein
MPEQPNPIIDIVLQFRKALENHDAQALSRLVRAYEGVYTRLKDKIDLLADAIELEAPTRGQLVRMTRYKELIAQVEDELTYYQAILRNEVENVSLDAINFAGRDASRLIKAIGAEQGVNIGYNRLPTEAIRALLGFLAPDSPLYERIDKLAGTHAEEVANAIIEGVSLGKNPRDTARVIRNIVRDKLGGGLTDALRMTRTVQLWSYREATRANYLANADVVEGWIWYAYLPGEPCMACIAQHGSFHTLDETLDDHYNGRCTMIPVVSGMPSVVEGTGEDWFKELPEAKQAELMGKEKFEAWQGGAFKFEELATKHTDNVYGDMTTEAPLWSLLGAEPPYTTK